MSPRHAATDSRRPGELLVQAGAVLFAIGLLAAVVAVVPAVVRDSTAPTILLVVAVSLLPLGLAIALVGLLRGARTRRRAARRGSST